MKGRTRKGRIKKSDEDLNMDRKIDFCDGKV
jgi:hypothetical protein